MGEISNGGSTPWCGGSVISDLWVLSAAHCTVGSRPGGLQVLLGEHNYLTSGETTTVRMDIAKIINHPKYNGAITNFDFSLLKLASKIDFASNSHIRPICLPAEGSTNDYNDYLATVTGWGTTSSGGDLSNKLREVSVLVMSNTECSAAYSSYTITDKMLCAGAQDGNGGKDSCQGDSGGPLVTKEACSSGEVAGENYEQIGVVSWGVGCALARYPGVYARVTKVISWIKTKTVSLYTCPRSKPWQDQSLAGSILGRINLSRYQPFRIKVI